MFWFKSKKKHYYEKKFSLQNINRQKTKRGRLFFVTELKMISNIHTEAKHSSLDLFEKTSVFVTFDGTFYHKRKPVYCTNGSILEFEFAGDRNNF